MKKFTVLSRILFNSAALLILAAMLLAVSGPAQAVNIGPAYTQDFTSMGTGTTLPGDWSVWKIGTGTGNQSVWNANSGIYANGTDGNSVQEMTEITENPVVSALSDSNIANNNTYKEDQAFNMYHTSGDPVLSTAPSGIFGNALQLKLTNNTNSNLNSLNLSYKIVKFNSGFGSGSEELPGYQLFYAVGDTSSTWYPVSPLNPVSVADGIHPVIPIGTVGQNGNGDYKEVTIANTLVNLTTSWGAGQNLYLRWVDDNATTLSPDQVIGLDNVNVSAVPIPAAAWLLGTGLIGLVAIRRRNK